MTASVLVKEAVETKIATAKELAHCFVDLIEAVLSWITIERYDKALSYALDASKVLAQLLRTLYELRH